MKGISVRRWRISERQVQMRTTVYFVRHAEPNYKNHIDSQREFSEKGWKDRELVTRYLWDREIDAVLSSPYKRAVDTVKDFAVKKGLEIETIADFRERRVDGVWIEDFDEFCRKQWEDFSYKLSDGETLGEVQMRNIRALKEALHKYEGKNIVVGSHGTALSTIIHFYESSFGYEDFNKIRHLMPWIVKFTFEGEICVEMERINLFSTDIR